MAANSKIEWTGDTWNPIAGCSIVSPGCAHCYAMRTAGRLEAMGQAKYVGTTKKANGKTLWTGNVNLDEAALSIPLRTRKPTTYFVNSMSDLFHHDVPHEFISRVFGVMASCPQHTFQVLTKRSERLQCAVRLVYEDPKEHGWWPCKWWHRREVEPLDNVWLGVSCENQKYADERIPWLLKTPAAVRFVSAEPLLGRIDFSSARDWIGYPGEASPSLDWLIVGGESGPGARPCRAEWILSIVEQCQAAGVSCFVKQLGSHVEAANDDVSEWLDQTSGVTIDEHRGPVHQGDPVRVRLKHKKGGAVEEWPEALRVRQFPARNEIPVS